MNRITIKTFVQKTTDKYLGKIQYLCKDFTNSIIYKMVMGCLEICLPLSNKSSSEKYIKLTNIIIPDIVENYNEYLPFRVTMDSETARKIIEKKIKNQNEGQTFRNK